MTKNSGKAGKPGGRRLKQKDIPKGPFALARVVRIIRKNAPDHMISSNVKNAMNHWLGEVAVDVSEKMNASRYTTLNLDDRLMREAKKRAAGNGETLTALIERALRAYLRPTAGRGKKFRLELLIKEGRPVHGVNWDDRDSLYERMEGRS